MSRVTTSKATTRATTTTATASTSARLRGRPVRVAVLGCVAALALVFSTGASASDATLKTALGHWSQRIAMDAHGIGLSASRRHPRRMMHRAQRFRADALRAVRALAPMHASSARGQRGKRLALAAFRAYAVVGRQWVLTGQARLRGQKAIAVAHARIAARYARRGSRLLRSAAKLI